MITRDYIKQCEKAYWEIGECDPNRRSFPFGAGFYPTLEQLFGIFSYLCNTNSKAHPEHLAGDHLPTHFINEIHNYLKKEKKSFSEEICLEIIMKDFYNKIWNGKDWEIKNE